MIYINTRHLRSKLTGFQRYIAALLERLGPKLQSIQPMGDLGRARGHLWEQLILPRKVGSSLLFSPANTGPLAIRKQLVTIHDVFQLDHPELMTHRFSTWYRFLTPRLARRVEHIITISEFSKARLLEHVPMDEGRITVIPIGVDQKFRLLPANELASLSSDLDLPSRHYVLCVGSLEPRKNLLRLIQAWARIEQNVPDDMWLVITGKRGNARVFADRNGLDDLPPRVHMTGHVSDDLLPTLYAGALVFAYPSVYEGFGLPPLEAMASGVPVLTSNQSSLPEVVGDAGMMVDPYDVEAIADGLLRLIESSDLRAQLRARGLERAKQFSWDTTAEKTWELIQKVDNQ